MTNNEPTHQVFEGPDAVEAYAFLVIRKALQARVERGMKLMGGREIEAAQNHGWTEARTAKGALRDMNKIAADCGF